ncbi:MAG: DUF427 domain-containing protein [Egibacteraceae bacterium]
MIGDQVIVDSNRPMLLLQNGRLPRYYFPLQDIRTELLKPSGHASKSGVIGKARHFDLRLGERLIPNAAWAYDAAGQVPDLSPYIAFYLRAMDRWLEEDVEIRGHARDPYHRVDAVPSSRHVRVSLDGQALAESERTVVIFETCLPPRWYFPLPDVRVDLEPSDLRTRCTYKGEAAYWSAPVGDRLQENLAWTYAEPYREVEPVRGLVCFFNERVDVELDGELEERPLSPWAETGWWHDTRDFEDQL